VHLTRVTQQLCQINELIQSLLFTEALMNRFPRIFLRSVHYGLQIYPYLDIASKLRSLLTVIEWQTALAWESSKCLWTPRKCRLEMLPFRFSMLIRRSNGLLSDWVEDAFRGSLISSHPVRVLDLVRLLVFELWLDELWFWEPNLLRTRGSDR